MWKNLFFRIVWILSMPVAFTFVIQNRLVSIPRSDLKDLALSVKFRKCQHVTWIQVEEYFTDCICGYVNQYCQDQFNCKLTSNVNRRFESESVMVFLETRKSGVFARQNFSELESWRTFVSAMIVIVYPISSASCSDNSTVAVSTVQKNILAKILLTYRVQVERQLQIHFVSIEQALRDATWIERWFWPLTIVFLVLAVACLKTGHFIVEQEFIYKERMKKMEQHSTVKAKKRYVGELLLQLYACMNIGHIESGRDSVAASMDVVRTISRSISETSVEQNDTIKKSPTATSNRTAFLARNSLPAITELSVDHLPPLGSCGYRQIVSKLMLDPTIDKQAKQLNSDNLEHMKLRNAARIWKLTLNRQRHSVDGTDALQQRRYSRVNMFTLLVGGKSTARRNSNSSVIDKSTFL